MSEQHFSILPLRSELLDNLPSLGYEIMTPIQAESLPAILAGQDVIGQGQTGSGKTAAFGLGLLHSLDTDDLNVQTLVLCPTRELADQVAEEIRRLARGLPNTKIITLTGGTKLRPQADSLARGMHIVVGTPGRVMDHITKETLELETVRTLVLDEADRMLDMGFEDAIDAIASYVAEHRQTMLFSATFPPEIESIAARLTIDPVLVQIAAEQTESTITEHFYRVKNNESRLAACQLLMRHHQPASTVLFCNTRRETMEIAKALNAEGFSAVALHGELDQRERDQRLALFANQSLAVLVATDVAARGLDIDELDMVLNYQLANEAEVHTHRIGRTGRAGAQGMACTLFTDKDQSKLAKLHNGKGQPLNPDTCGEPLPGRDALKNPPPQPSMFTIEINGGKKQKLRKGDILGALTGEGGIEGSDVGKIQIAATRSLVAVARHSVKPALRKLGQDKIKGRSYKVRWMDED